jgi:hypothetical protein
VRATCAELRVELDAPGVLRAAIEWGGVRVSVERLSVSRSRGHGAVSRCTCPHWGYVRTGRLRVAYPDHDEVISAGDLYYAAPGHVLLVEEDSDLVELSPADAWTRAAATLDDAGGKCGLHRGHDLRDGPHDKYMEGEDHAH